MTDTDGFPVPDYPGLLRLADKGFIVAGAGYGMGRQAAHALAQCGARVVCADIDGERASQVAGQVGGIAWQGDITRREGAEALVVEAERALDRIDGLIDIVGLAEWAPALDLDDATWDRQFAICLRHAYLLGQLVGRRLVARGAGTMVFIASVSGLDAAPMHGAYGAAKAGLMSWVRTLAVELGGKGVRVNAIAPGAIHTPRLHASMSSQDAAVSARGIPLRRLGEPDDIAAAALFLSSGLSAYITGRVLVVDGGVDAKFPFFDADGPAR
ncbi:MAG: SDR family NAD(P)-dependent oxidoreductase [Gammaproteobacteria bacterium]